MNYTGHFDECVEPEAVGELIASSLYWAQRRLEEKRAALGVRR